MKQQSDVKRIARLFGSVALGVCCVIGAEYIAHFCRMRDEASFALLFVDCKKALVGQTVPFMDAVADNGIPDLFQGPYYGTATITGAKKLNEPPKAWIDTSTNLPTRSERISVRITATAGLGFSVKQTAYLPIGCPGF